MFRTDANLSNLTKVRRFLIAPNIRISNISVCSIEKSFYVLVSTNESLMLFAVTGKGVNEVGLLTNNPCTSPDERIC